MKVCLPGLVLLITVGWAAVSRAADDPTAIAIWPGKTPQETGQFEDKTTGEAPRRRVESVATPTITVFRPEKEKNTGAAMLIAPGGGYNFLSWDHEGVGVARWLNSLGMTGVVLKYRVPRRPDQSREAPTFGPLQDAQRAMSLVRSKAREWEI
ncbi:MAG: alpha/beta hydrolase, partial [Planctomycetes bacterium]|nr:alpha/beta hydrolase [Planctomycetota bacterium]